MSLHEIDTAATGGGPELHIAVLHWERPWRAVPTVLVAATQDQLVRQLTTALHDWIESDWNPERKEPLLAEYPLPRPGASIAEHRGWCRHITELLGREGLRIGHFGPDLADLTIPEGQTIEGERVPESMYLEVVTWSMPESEPSVFAAMDLDDLKPAVADLVHRFTEAGLEQRVGDPYQTLGPVPSAAWPPGYVDAYLEQLVKHEALPFVRFYSIHDAPAHVRGSAEYRVLPVTERGYLHPPQRDEMYNRFRLIGDLIANLGTDLTPNRPQAGSRHNERPRLEELEDAVEREDQLTADVNEFLQDAVGHLRRASFSLTAAYDLTRGFDWYALVRQQREEALSELLGIRDEEVAFFQNGDPAKQPASRRLIG